MLFLQGLCMFLNIYNRFQVLDSGFKACNRWILFPICNDLNYISSFRVLVSKLLNLMIHIPEVRFINPELWTHWPRVASTSLNCLDSYLGIWRGPKYNLISRSKAGWTAQLTVNIIQLFKMTRRPFMPKILIHGFEFSVGLDKTNWVKSQPE